MNLDYRLFRIFNDLAAHGHILRAIARAGATDLLYAFPIALLLVWMFPGREGHAVRTAALLAVVAALVALGGNQLLNHMVNRSRPYTTHHVHLLLPRSGDTSFPSDHTAVAFAVVASLWPVRRRTALVLGALGILLGLSRVVAGVHYPGDVLGGACVGVASAIVVRSLGLRPISLITAWGERLYNGIAKALSLGRG